jgi:ATP adenylyltransferase
MQYLENGSDPDQCPFCLVLEEGDHSDHYLIARGKKAFIVLNRYPYTTGHVLVLPLSHRTMLSELDQSTRGEIMELINQALDVLGRVYQPDGFNVGLNLGSAAGAGIPSHLHWHVVPRWSGDTSYMTVTGGVRVLPELLADTLQKLRSAWEDS